MHIDEAINRLEVFVRDASEVAPELLDDAVRLGIEALKRVKLSRDNPSCLFWKLLYGETKE